MPSQKLPWLPRPNLLRWVWIVSALIGLAGYGGYCAYHARILPGGSDSSGYFNLARALVSGRIDLPARPIEGMPPATAPSYAYTPLGFRPHAGGETITPTYPLGLPVLLAAVSEIAGWTAGPPLLFGLLAAAGLALTFLLARQVGLAPPLAALAATALALSPLYLRYCLYAMSDLPALVVCATALWLALRPGLPSAFGTGAAIGLAVLIRPSNVLIIAPALVALGLNWRRLIGTIGGGLPFALVFAAYNKSAYGAAWSTGYGDVSTAFSTEWALNTALHYAKWLPLLLSPLILLAALAPLAPPTHRRTLAVHGTWVFLVGSFYLFYYHTHETWWYLRFILPVFPSLIVLALSGGTGLVARLRSTPLRRALGAAAVGVVIVCGIHEIQKLDVVSGVQEEDVYPQGSLLVRSEVPANAMLLAMQHSGSLYFGTSHVIVRWDLLENQWPRFRDAAWQSGRPIYALLFDFELEPALKQQIPGAWRTLRDEGNLHLLRLEPETAP